MRNPGRKKKIVLGLTGGIGCGKSTVANIFKLLGADIVDADRIAHGLMRPKNPVYKKIISVFGKGVLKSNGEIDRSKLGRIVFSNNIALHKLNGIAHPEIIRLIREKIKDSSKRMVVVDAPLLVETGLIDCVDKVIVVKASRKIQLQRLEENFRLSKDEIEKRIASQIPLKQKIGLADFVIDNNGSIAQTKKQAGLIRRKLWKS